MKIVSSKEMARIEHMAYKKGASEAAFMEAAGRGVALNIQHFVQEHGLDQVATFLCGKGNNSGDAYVAATLLKHAGFATTVYQLTPIEQSSPLCVEHHHRYVSDGGYVKSVLAMTDCQFPETGVIVDGLFGTGFHGVAEGIFGMVIELANQSDLPILAIDIPSGLNGETGAVEGPVMQAVMTIFLGLPKVGFFLRDGWNHVGRLVGVDFGLDADSVQEGQADALLLDDSMVKGLMPPIVRNRHKYQVGLVVGLAGSPGMPGAAMLACLGAMRGGAGLVRLLHPAGMQAELAASPYELVRIPYRVDEHPVIIEALNAGSACFVGPGFGRRAVAQELLSKVLPAITVPTVIDADGLYWIAVGGVAMPKEVVLTPHVGEMRRLLGSSEKGPITRDFLVQIQEYADRHQATIVLKGGPSWIFYPGETPLVCPRGDPGMATGGTGDVLAGVIAALLSQGLRTFDAAALGTYLHGMAGERTAEAFSSYSMIASDIADGLPEAFLWL